jgi:dTDP-4-amino-4,6-dideoxygalactose transaminase
MFMSRVNDILNRRWLSNNGRYVQEFEKKIAEIAGVEHAVVMCNATVALEIAARALEFRGEVIVPSYTFIATAHALQWQGIQPVFADIDPLTHNISPDDIKKKITDKTTGIIGVHLWGRGCSVEEIESIARDSGIRVMYDASHAFGCTTDGKMIGGFGECEVFSFHATKFINSLEGGAVVTNSSELAEKIRLMRNFGFKGYDNVVYPGINGKMNEVCAAMGITSLEAMPEIIKVNRVNYEAYRAGLTGIPGISLINYDRSEKNNYQYVVIEVEANISLLTRDELVDFLHSHNVIARKYFWPGCHRMEPYQTLQPGIGTSLPSTESVAEKVIVLPTGQGISSAQVSWICSLIAGTMRKGRR